MTVFVKTLQVFPNRTHGFIQNVDICSYKSRPSWITLSTFLLW